MDMGLLWFVVGVVVAIFVLVLVVVVVVEAAAVVFGNTEAKGLCLEELPGPPAVKAERISEDDDDGGDDNGDGVAVSTTLEPALLQYWRDRKCIEGSATSKRNDMVLYPRESQTKGWR